MEPTTQEALDLLNAKIAHCEQEITNHQSAIDTQTKLKAGYQLEADLLQGIIDTPANDLVAEKAKVIALTSEKQTLEEHKIALEAQVTGLGETPVTQQ